MALGIGRKSCLLATTFLSAQLASVSAADAQERIRERLDTDRVLGTIEVTAQKRTEDLQDVPISITTFDAVALDTLRIDGFDDIANFTPGVIASPNAGDSSGLSVFIRGIGQNDPQVGLDATVGFYLDGVYIGKTPGLSFDVPDLERIEVVKGPQGTLFGRNAVAGAISIITKGAEIGEGFGGNATLEVGNFDTVALRGAVNIPLGETAALKVSGVNFDRDGFVENVETNFPLGSLPGVPDTAGFQQFGQGADFGGSDRSAITAEIAWEPMSNLRLEYGFEDNRTNIEPFFTQSVPDFATGTFGFLLAPTLEPGAAPLLPITEGRQEEAVSTVPIGETRSEVIGHRAEATWDWHPNHSSKILFGYRRADTDAFTGFFTEANPFVLDAVFNTGQVDASLPSDPLSNPSLIDTFAVTLPLTTNTVLQPMVGDDIDITLRPDFAEPFLSSFNPPLFPGPFFSFGVSPDTGIPTLDGHEQFQIEYTQTGTLGDRIDYTFGLFYFDETTATGPFNDRPGDALGVAQLLPALELLVDVQTAFAGPPGELVDTLRGIAGEEGFGAILSAARSPGTRLELDTQAFAVYGEAKYQLTDALSITGGLRYSRDEKEAFQQGISPFFNDTTDLLGNPIPALEGDEVFDSLDPRVVLEYEPTEDLLFYASYSQAFRSGGFNQSSVNLADFLFDEERIRSGEIGVKSDFFNDRFRINANVFASFVDDQQVSFTNPAVPVTRFIVNNDTRFVGLEVDGQFVVGDYTTASFSYAFLDAEADDLTNPFTGLPAGQPDNAPRHSFGVNLDYDRPVGPGDLQAHLGFNYKDETTVIGVPRTDSALLDARLAYTLSSGDDRRITVFVYGQNLTDDEFTIDALDAFAPLVATTQVFGLPRTYGGGITVAF
ncbi:MAG: TonB-dependent receptor [Pseudomonadota bacterium]